MQSIIAGIFGLAMASVIIWNSFVQWGNVSRLNSWKATEGKVIERGTFRVTHSTLSVSAFQHAPLVKYVYKVNGQEFTGDAILPKHIQLPEHSTVEWAQARAASFPDDLTVYYNPENPSDSFLVPVSRKTLYIMLIAGPVVVLFSLFLLISGIGQTIKSAAPGVSE
ncbi:MAG: DUF3592 domain-containing protein [Pyrinomonadaceae bacterium]|nr:DUF3592 domain-containing protein [Pyrinomonadaceae bacterium]